MIRIQHRQHLFVTSWYFRSYEKAVGMGETGVDNNTKVSFKLFQGLARVGDTGVRWTPLHSSSADRANRRDPEPLVGFGAKSQYTRKDW
ncbi:MAG TPA: hypothetical protein DEO95_03955 [Ruminococcaceae bacterium]|nr:hypothetical protein [Oscillospiraceae bacterium]